MMPINNCSCLGCMKVLQCLYLCWVWLHPLCGENCSIEGYLGLSDDVFVTVKDEAILIQFS